jgi:hypothetical protein
VQDLALNLTWFRVGVDEKKDYFVQKLEILDTILDLVVRIASVNLKGVINEKNSLTPYHWFAAFFLVGFRPRDLSMGG